MHGYAFSSIPSARKAKIDSLLLIHTGKGRTTKKIVNPSFEEIERAIDELIPDIDHFIIFDCESIFQDVQYVQVRIPTCENDTDGKYQIETRINCDDSLRGYKHYQLFVDDIEIAKSIFVMFAMGTIPTMDLWTDISDELAEKAKQKKPLPNSIEGNEVKNRVDGGNIGETKGLKNSSDLAQDNGYDILDFQEKIINEYEREYHLAVTTINGVPLLDIVDKYERQAAESVGDKYNGAGYTYQMSEHLYCQLKEKSSCASDSEPALMICECLEEGCCLCWLR
jgi:hypothetical protein